MFGMSRAVLSECFKPSQTFAHFHHITNKKLQVMVLQEKSECTGTNLLAELSFTQTWYAKILVLSGDRELWTASIRSEL